MNSFNGIEGVGGGKHNLSELHLLRMVGRCIHFDMVVNKHRSIVKGKKRKGVKSHWSFGTNESPSRGEWRWIVSW